MLDPRLPFYESIIAFLADIAQWERERLSERTKAGLRRAVAQGKTLGRPKGAAGTTEKGWSGGVFDGAYLGRDFKCERCGHTWVPRMTQPPKVCPKCKSPYWDTPRKGKPKGKEAK